eukprot:1449424-Alexandrium_andersonii.AAC.1
MRCVGIPDPHLALVWVREHRGARSRAPCVAGPSDEAVPMGNEAAFAPGIVQGLLNAEQDHDGGA